MLGHKAAGYRKAGANGRCCATCLHYTCATFWPSSIGYNNGHLVPAHCERVKQPIERYHVCRKYTRKDISKL